MSHDQDDLFASEELLDCHGRVTHRLVLAADGNVRVTMCASGVTVVVDPNRRRVITPGVELSPALVDVAASLRPG